MTHSTKNTDKYTRSRNAKKVRTHTHIIQKKSGHNDHHPNYCGVMMLSFLTYDALCIRTAFHSSFVGMSRMTLSTMPITRNSLRVRFCLCSCNSRSFLLSLLLLLLLVLLLRWWRAVLRGGLCLTWPCCFGWPWWCGLESASPTALFTDAVAESRSCCCYFHAHTNNEFELITSYFR